MVAVFPPLRTHRDCAVATFETEGVDVGADRLGHPSPLQARGETRTWFRGDERPAAAQDCAEPIAVEVGAMGLVADVAQS